MSCRRVEFIAHKPLCKLLKNVRGNLHLLYTDADAEICAAIEERGTGILYTVCLAFGELRFTDTPAVDS